MADRIADELLRFTATSSFRLHDDEVRAIAAELLAARARIQQLEGFLVDRMTEALDKLPSLSDQRWMVMKHKETP